MDFNFHMPVKIISGEGCILKSGGQLRELGCRCLILTSNHAAQACGALDDMLQALKAERIEASVFSDISANPLMSQCRSAALAAEAYGADFLVGIGGGSVMDAAKVAAWIATNITAPEERVMQCDLHNPPLPMALVGTTAGTGSEVSAVAVITMDKDGRKRSVTSVNCYAKIVFADPRYTHSVPRSTTVSTALDSFSHAAEGWFVPSCGDVISAFAEKALPMIMDGLEWLNRNDGLPDAALRARMFYGSIWAGMVLNATGTAFPHPLGYILTEKYDVPHGMACAAFLPAFFERAEQYTPERADAFYAMCGGRDRAVSVLGGLVRYDVSMTETQIAAYKPRWDGIKNFVRTPGGFSADDSESLFKTLFVR